MWVISAGTSSLEATLSLESTIIFTEPDIFGDVKPRYMLHFPSIMIQNTIPNFVL
jgi:hypothetical protein